MGFLFLPWGLDLFNIFDLSYEASKTDIPLGANKHGS